MRLVTVRWVLCMAAVAGEVQRYRGAAAVMGESRGVGRVFVIVVSWRARDGWRDEGGWH